MLKKPLLLCFGLSKIWADLCYLIRVRADTPWIILLAATPRLITLMIRREFRPPNWRVQIIIDGERVACASVGNLADIFGGALFDGV